MTETKELLAFFKAMADANRLKIVGLLARQPYTVEQLAALLGLGASTVSHHLSKLAEAGLVTATAQSYYNFYRLEADRYEAMTRQMTLAHLPALADSVDSSVLEQKALDPDQKIVNNYLLPNGKLKTIPGQQKKLLAVLRHIVKDFEPEKHYSERQVNEMLSHYHSDTATLRREMIGTGLMGREGGGGNYWRINQETQETGE